mmetsp:Transcript_21307/g.65584  ORF Transcript_21307/g.65584 Transcript_21307/m.65584 type:complete len:119 (+) Transcript_21307:832-1188(+)
MSVAVATSPPLSSAPATAAEAEAGMKPTLYVPKPICGWLVPSLSATVGALLSELMRGDDRDRPRAAPIIAVARREASRIVFHGSDSASCQTDASGRNIELWSSCAGVRLSCDQALPAC